MSSRSFLKVYKKASDIEELSRSISGCLHDDLSDLNGDGTEDPNIYYCGDIIQQSGSLLFNIRASASPGSSYKYFNNTLNLLHRLLNNCKKLEYCKSDGRNYVPLLSEELTKFRRLYNKWILSL